MVSWAGERDSLEGRRDGLSLISNQIHLLQGQNLGIIVSGWTARSMDGVEIRILIMYAMKRKFLNRFIVYLLVQTCLEY